MAAAGRPALRPNRLDNDSQVLFDASMNHAGPPHNPGVRELVAGKRKWASSLTVEQAKAVFTRAKDSYAADFFSIRAFRDRLDRITFATASENRLLA